MSATVYCDWEIVRTDEEDRSNVHVVETLRLTTAKEARRIAQAWQACSWVEGRKFDCRLKSEPTALADLK